MALVSKNERLLFDFLKEGPRQYSEIIEYLDKTGIKRRTANNLLKECCSSGKLFRIERKGGKVFYRLNDFPKEVQLFLAFVDSYPHSNNFKKLLDQLKDDVIKLHGKLTFDQILNLWYAYIKGLGEVDKQTKELLTKTFTKFRESL